MSIGTKIQKDILDYMERQKRPVSTREIGLGIGRAWHSIQNHCLRLQLAGQINGFRVGNMNLWELRRRRK
jgi:hypothetical protein